MVGRHRIRLRVSSVLGAGLDDEGGTAVSALYVTAQHAGSDNLDGWMKEAQRAKYIGAKRRRKRQSEAPLGCCCLGVH